MYVLIESPDTSLFALCYGWSLSESFLCSLPPYHKLTAGSARLNSREEPFWEALQGLQRPLRVANVVSGTRFDKMSSVSWLDLPDHCLSLVLGNLAAPDVASARLVCAHWARIALGARTQVHIRRALSGLAPEY